MRLRVDWTFIQDMLAVVAVLGVLIILTHGCTATAHAIPPFFANFEQRYANPQRDPQFAALVAEVRCNVCHAGTTKKQFNLYGQYVRTQLNKDRFTVGRLRSDPEGARQEILQGLRNVESRAISPSHETFKDAILGGRLPAVAQTAQKAVP